MVDPNIVYLVLVFGLWAAVTAVYIPGTGVPEAFALLGLGGGIWLLSALPTNWVAVVILCVGVLSFLLIPFVHRRFARLAEAGLVLQIGGALTLFNGVQIAWLLIAVTIGLSVLYHRLVLLPFLEKSRNQPAVIDDSKQLIGSFGRVTKSSEQLGETYLSTINVRGETWTAHSDDPLKLGDEVQVMEREGLQLYVEGVKHKSRKEMEETE